MDKDLEKPAVTPEKLISRRNALKRIAEAAVVTSVGLVAASCTTPTYSDYIDYSNYYATYTNYYVTYTNYYVTYTNYYVVYTNYYVVYTNYYVVYTNYYVVYTNYYY